MTTVTIQATDTASAMEKIVEQLGEDALILSTSKKQGKIIMKAAKSVDFPSPSKTLETPTNFSNLYNSNLSDISESQAGLSKVSKSKFTENGTKTKNNQNCSSTQLAMMNAISLLADRIDQLDQKLSGMMLVGTDGLNPSLECSTPVRLTRAGYCHDTVLRLRPAYAGQSFEKGINSFLESLAQELVEPNSETLLQKRVLFVVGATGSGRTTLASKLAASLKDTHPGKEIALASLSATLNETDTKLRGYARLLNIPVNQMTQDMPVQNFDKMTDFDILVVDVTLPPEDAVEQVGRFTKYLGKQEASVILSLAGGSSSKMISNTISQFAPLAPTVGLTKLDECETTSIEFSELAEAGGRISLLSGTKSVVGAIAFASEKILTQYLTENFEAEFSKALSLSEFHLKK